jgi:MoxR-like ATPase
MTETSAQDAKAAQLQKAQAVVKQLQTALGDVVKTSPDNLRLVLISLLCRGHLLIEDAPGLGKTTLAKALSQLLALRMKRVQCTPDLMPSDITGISIYNATEHKFDFIPGPVFSNILLADEINRATPRTQSALLEAMAESTVTSDRKTYNLPSPFMVIATQNPVEFSGTFPLPEAQLDRFFMRLSLGYPDEAQEIDIMMGQLQGHPLDKLKPLINEATLSVLQKQAEKVTISEPMVRYIGQIVRETRIQPGVRLGVSPRGSLALMRAARAMAMLKGKTSVTPDIIPSLLEPILGHRIVFRDSSLNQADSRKEFWNKITTSVAIPDFPEAEESGYY